MNLSKIALDNVSLEIEKPADLTPALREREAHLIRVIEAIQGVSESTAWKSLKDLIFDGEVERLEKSISSAAKAKEIAAPELYRLQGKLSWAEKYADLDKLVREFKVELANVKKQLQNAENH